MKRAWLAMRLSSQARTRMCSARRGTSRPEQLLRRQDRQRLAEHGGGVLERVAVADGVVPVAVLADLLDAAVEVAQDGVEVHDALAVDLEDDAQDAVRRGVLRPEVDEHLAVAEGVELGLALRARRAAAGWRRRWWPASGPAPRGRPGSGCASAPSSCRAPPPPSTRACVPGAAPGDRRRRRSPSGPSTAPAPGLVRSTAVARTSAGRCGVSMGRMPSPGARDASSARAKSLRSGKPR